MLKSPSSPCVVNGFTMKSELVDGLPLRRGCVRAPASSLRRADASAFPSPFARAPVSSARYSREREMASWRMSAMSGARSARKIMPAIFPESSSLEPNIAANCAVWARKLITAARVAAMVVMSMSLFLMCPSSCAKTPRNSSGVKMASIPSVTATIAFLGVGPVANAFGVWVGTR